MISPVLSVSVKTDAGIIRKNNEDYAGFLIPVESDKLNQYGSIFVVADGVGGSEKGEIASKLTVETIINSYYMMPLEILPEERLKKSFEKANDTVISKSMELRSKSMSSTAVCAVVIGDSAYIGNVGDSRAYLIKIEKTVIQQITFDHSLVAEQVRMGILTKEQAKYDLNRNIITRAIGVEPTIQVDLFNLDLIKGDKLLLCSDGLVRVVEDNEIFNVVSSSSIEEATSQLINLANSRDGPDNITVCLVSIEP
jgi:protein phosphatase